MRKKFLAMYALVGALVASPIFTSCIDDSESESVTAVRKEKAEQQRIANQIAAAKAELQMQYDKVQLEANITNYEALLLEYQLKLKKNQDELNAYGVQTLSQLTSAYTTALSYAAQSEWQIALYNKEIADMEAGLVSAQKAYAKSVDNLNKQIAEAEAEIAALKKIQEDGMDAEALNGEVAELEAVKNKAEKELKELMAQYGFSNINTNSAPEISNASNLATIKAYNALNAPAPVADGDPVDDGSTSTVTELSLIGTNAEGFYYLNKSVVIEKQEELAAAIKTAQDKLDEAVAAIGTEADTEETTVSEDSEDLTLYAQLAQAKKELADAGEEATEEQEKAVTDAEKAIVKANDELVPLKDAVATAEQASKDFEANIAAFEGEDYEAYKAAVVALDDAYTTYMVADAEYSAYNSAYSETGVNNISEDIKTKEQNIDGWKAELENLKLNIDAYDIYNVDNVNTNEVDSEELLASIIAYLEKQIAIEETKLATYNKQAEEAKAALDAYLGTEA